MCVFAATNLKRKKIEFCWQEFLIVFVATVYTLLAVEISQRPGFISSFVFLSWRLAFGRTTHSPALQVIFIFSLGDCVFFGQRANSSFMLAFGFGCDKIAFAQSTVLNEHILLCAATVHSALNFFATFFLFLHSVNLSSTRAYGTSAPHQSHFFTSRWEIASRTFAIALVFVLRRHG